MNLSGAICVQRLDDSRVAGRINFRSSLRSSSTREPSDPLLAVVLDLLIVLLGNKYINCFQCLVHKVTLALEMLINVWVFI